MANRDRRIGPTRLTWAALFAAIALAIPAGGYWYYRVEAEHIRQDKYRLIAAIAELKADQILKWRQERLIDAGNSAQSPFFRQALQKWLRAPETPGLRKDWRERLELDQKSYGYSDVLILDPDGNILLALRDAHTDPRNPATQRAIAAALADHKAALSDLYRCPHGVVHIDAAIPVLDAEGRPLAVFLLRSDAASFLYPLIQSWPTPSRSAETLLVQREGEEVLYLNNLRHQADAALSLRQPMAQTDLPAVQAVLGIEGLFQGKDYRGAEVLAALRPIPGTPWFMVAKVDTGEILAEARYRAHMIALVVGLGLLLAAAVAAYAYRRRQAALYGDLYRSEQAQRKVEEEFRITLYSIGDGGIAADRESRVRQMNPVAENLTGWTEAEARGKPLDEVFRIVNEETRAVVENPVEGVLREGQVVGLANHTLLIARDGTERPIADSAAPIRDESGAVTGVVLVFRDQTAERAALKALADRTVQLERANRELVSLNAELDDFTNMASHDLQEPLRALTTFSDLLGKDLGHSLPERAAQDLGFITEAAKRMQTLIHDLLALARVGRIAKEREKVSLHECADQALEASAMRVKETGAEVTRDELPVLWGDSTLLTQLYQNLIGNALKFSGKQRPIIRLTVEEREGKQIFGAQDNGIGIEPKYAQQIFQPFKRLHGQAEYEGSGIGLAICRKIVERHGGKIWVESELGKGAHFRFTISNREGTR